MKYFLFLFLIIGFSNRALSADTASSDFLSLCKATLQYKPKNLPLCEEIHNKFFKNNKTNDIASVSPVDVNAPFSPIDYKIQYFIFNDPNYLSGMAYCYFVFRSWISSSTMGPDTLATHASGFSILNEDILEYKKWLQSSVAGKSCKALVEKESEVSVADLEAALKGKVALIGLNPYATINTNENPTVESVLNEMKLTINHERIHAFHVACPEFEKWSIKEWEKLPASKKNEYIKKYPSYTWSIPKIAGREYIGFLYEGTPEKVTEHITNCKF